MKKANLRNGIYYNNGIYQEPFFRPVIIDSEECDYEMMNKIDDKLYNLFVKAEKEIISFIEKHANKEKKL